MGRDLLSLLDCASHCNLLQCFIRTRIFAGADDLPFSFAIRRRMTPAPRSPAPHSRLAPPLIAARCALPAPLICHVALALPRLARSRNAPLAPPLARTPPAARDY